MLLCNTFVADNERDAVIHHWTFERTADKFAEIDISEELQSIDANI